jgi:hypothetical protein
MHTQVPNFSGSISAIHYWIEITEALLFASLPILFDLFMSAAHKTINILPYNRREYKN